MNKAFLLEQDLLENRQVQFIYNGVVITQENGTNPRIKRLSARAANDFITVAEKLPDYEVRVILPVVVAFTVNGKFQINWQPQIIDYKAIDIKASFEEGLFVIIYLAKLLP
jgi:hypothetical protein